MSQLTLWKTDASPPANAVRALADILGVKLDVIDVDFANMEHKSPELLKMNPLGTIPVLKDGDFILTDSHAQMKYLLSKFGAEQSEKLYPSELRARALVDQSLFLDAAVLFIRLKVVAVSIIATLTYLWCHTGIRRYTSLDISAEIQSQLH
ncbi:Glutathione S-transferase epsilon, partial [Operophtera brumata]